MIGGQVPGAGHRASAEAYAEITEGSAEGAELDGNEKQCRVGVPATLIGLFPVYEDDRGNRFASVRDRPWVLSREQRIWMARSEGYARLCGWRGGGVFDTGRHIEQTLLFGSIFLLAWLFFVFPMSPLVLSFEFLAVSFVVLFGVFGGVQVVRWWMGVSRVRRMPRTLINGYLHCSHCPACVHELSGARVDDRAWVVTCSECGASWCVPRSFSLA